MGKILLGFNCPVCLVSIGLGMEAAEVDHYIDHHSTWHTDRMLAFNQRAQHPRFPIYRMRNVVLAAMVQKV